LRPGLEIVNGANDRMGRDGGAIAPLSHPIV